MEKVLLTNNQTTSLKNESSNKRKINIQYINDLPRTELTFHVNARQILVVKTPLGKEILLQYPAKRMATEGEKRHAIGFFPKSKNE